MALIPPVGPAEPLYFERGLIFNAVPAGNIFLAMRNIHVLSPSELFRVQVGLISVEITQTSATAMALDVIRGTGGTPTSSTFGLGTLGTPPAGAQASANTRLDTAWSVNPTPQAGFSPFKFMQPVASIGSRVEWNWPEDNPLGIPNQGASVGIGNQLLFRNVGGGPTGTFQMNLRWCEWRTVL